MVRATHADSAETARRTRSSTPRRHATLVRRIVGLWLAA